MAADGSVNALGQQMAHAACSMRAAFRKTLNDE
jgi:hypothetical protein